MFLTISISCPIGHELLYGSYNIGHMALFFINILGAIMLHDCIYQFVRLFYHSRFKPPQLQMTWAQFGTPVIDVVLVVPKIFKLAQNISRFTNEARMRLKSKPGIKRREQVLIE